MIDLSPAVTLPEFMSYEYTGAIAQIDKSLESLRALWADAKYEAIRDQVMKSIDQALDKRIELMARRDDWLNDE